MSTSNYYLELAYAKRLGSNLERFHIKKPSPFLAAARCPVCGDSVKVKSKTRFYLYEKDKQINAICHNCGLSTTLIKFLKNNFKQLFNEFIFEAYRKDHKKLEKEPEFKPIITYEKLINLDLPLVKDLPNNHPAKLYIESRKLPDYGFQFANQFYKFSSQFNEAFEKITKDEPRLIIPFFDRSGNTFAYQGRDLSGRAKQKYITVIVNPKIPKIFGIDRLKINEKILLVEGPIDSLFLPNCVASVNASLTSTAKRLLSGINKNPDDIVIILDNEPRNKHVLIQYEKAIDAGYPIVIWPQKIVEKDINEMVKSGYDPLKIINENTYRGLLAKLNFNKWKKI